MSTERLQAMQDNFAFHEQFRRSLTEVVRPLSVLRTLDYGAGAFPLPFSLFSKLHQKEEITAFDPELDLTIPVTSLPGEVPTRWLNTVPEGEFDLVICHFSIHHMDRPPAAVIGDLRKYNPKFVAIAEYDFVSVLEEVFKNLFIADAERKELEVLFGGDVAACFRLHSQYGQTDYRQALEEHDFKIAQMGFGQRYAAHKLFVIGDSGKKVLNLAE